MSKLVRPVAASRDARASGRVRFFAPRQKIIAEFLVILSCRDALIAFADVWMTAAKSYGAQSPARVLAGGLGLVGAGHGIDIVPVYTPS